MEWTRWEKGLAWLWLAAAFWTALAFLIPSLSSLILFLSMIILIGPAFLMLLPTVLLYLTGAAPIYILLQRYSRKVGCIAGILFAGTLGVIIPTVANQKMTQRVAAATLHDGGGRVEAPKDSVIAYLSAYGPSINDSECEEYCQRLLFSGVARAVIRGHVEALDGKPVELQRYWFGPVKGRCRPAQMTIVHADEKDVGNYFPVPLLQQKAQQAYGEGKCFFRKKSFLSEADLILARKNSWPQNNRRGSIMDFRSSEIRQSWIAVYARSGTSRRQIMRTSFASTEWLAVPLALEAPFIFDTHTPGHWRWNGEIKRGRETQYGLSEFLTNDLRVRGLTTESGEPLPRQTGEQ